MIASASVELDARARGQTSPAVMIPLSEASSMAFLADFASVMTKAGEDVVLLVAPRIVAFDRAVALDRWAASGEFATEESTAEATVEAFATAVLALAASHPSMASAATIRPSHPLAWGAYPSSMTSVITTEVAYPFLVGHLASFPFRKDLVAACPLVIDHREAFLQASFPFVTGLAAAYPLVIGLVADCP